MRNSSKYAKKKSVSTSQASSSSKSKGSSFLSKVGGFFKKVVPVAASFIPGPVGTIAKAITGNDPEWWSDPAGMEVATNVPYSEPITVGTAGTSKYSTPRHSILEFVSGPRPDQTADYSAHIMDIPLEFVDTYLLPKVRRVVNAVYLRENTEYQQAFEVGATIYALKKTLEKWKYMAERSLPIFPTFNDPHMPMLTTTQKANLDAAISQLAEKLRASVRLPATLCRYLDWRFGRIFRSNNSAKAGIVLYDAITLNIPWTTGSPTASLSGYIEALFTELSTVSQANADLFNAYHGHTQDVAVDPVMQYHYDAKEFVLRTNLDVDAKNLGTNDDQVPNVIIMDSELDNKTVFMASTVSVRCIKGGDTVSLFPIDTVIAWAYCSSAWPGNGFAQLANYYYPGWNRIDLEPVDLYEIAVDGSISVGQGTYILNTLRLVAAKQLDYYNAELFVALKPAAEGAALTLVDLTSIDIDTGIVPDDIIYTEQKYAFANLVSERANYAGKNAAAKEILQDFEQFVQEEKIG